MSIVSGPVGTVSFRASVYGSISWYAPYSLRFQGGKVWRKRGEKGVKEKEMVRTKNRGIGGKKGKCEVKYYDFGKMENMGSKKWRLWEVFYIGHGKAFKIHGTKCCSTWLTLLSKLSRRSFSLWLKSALASSWTLLIHTLDKHLQQILFVLKFFHFLEINRRLNLKTLSYL